MKLPGLLLIVVLILTAVSCKKKSSNTTTFKATLVNVGPAMGYTGNATVTWDGMIYTIDVTHNLGTVTTSADGMYNRSTGLGINTGGFWGKTSPMVIYGDFSVTGNVTDIMANLYEIRFYKAGAIVLQGTLIKQ